jgi:hypothetical protein
MKRKNLNRSRKQKQYLEKKEKHIKTRIRKLISEDRKQLKRKDIVWIEGIKNQNYQENQTKTHRIIFPHVFYFDNNKPKHDVCSGGIITKNLRTVVKTYGLDMNRGTVSLSRKHIDYLVGKCSKCGMEGIFTREYEF